MRYLSRADFEAVEISKIGADSDGQRAFFVDARAGGVFFLVVALRALGSPDFVLAAPPMTVSTPGPGAMLVSSPVSQRTRNMDPLTAVTTPRRAPAFERIEILSPMSATSPSSS